MGNLNLTFRLKRQISFGGNSNKENHISLSKNEPNKIKPIIPSKPNSNGMSFGGQSQAKNNIEDFLLNDILQLQTPAPELSPRFGFGSVSSRIGESCVTPLGGQGSCQFIVADQCRPVLNRIIKYGVTQSLLKYLLAAIKSPCGFEQNDLSLCCAEKAITTSTTITTTTSSPISSSTSSIPPIVECGISPIVDSRVVIRETMRIVGGEVATPGAWPWTGLLGRSGLSGGLTVVCGGSLIAPDTILTAAHCFEGNSRDPTLVRLGEHDITKSDETKLPAIDINIDQVVKHPDWDSTTLENDIAIVKISSNVTYSESISPICLPDDYEDQDLVALLSSQFDPVVVGWGATQTYGPAETVLRQATVPLVTESSCAQAYSGVNVNIGQNKVCAGQGGTDTCNGDSGGPLLADRINNRWSVLGITSFGVECGRPDFPGVYTRVDKYLDFIKQHL